MTFLWINLAIVFILSFFSRYFATPVLATGAITPIKPNKILVLGALLSLVFISGLRSGIGDTFFYARIYVINDFTWEFITSQKDIGFGILQMLLKKYSDDPQIMIFTTALITNVLIISVLYKYSRIFELSVYVYITGGLFLVSMNGIRQVLAAAIIFTATKYLINGNWLKYFLIVLLSSTFHQSTLILIPIYFLVRYKAWSNATYIVLFFALVIVVGYNQFSAILFTVIEDTQYGHYSNFKEGGANVFRVAVNAAPLIIAYLGREKLREIFPSSDIIVNMSLIGFVFMMVSTQNWIFARFSIYFSLYQLILISWIVKLFSIKYQRLVYYALLICYLLYYFYENVMSLNIIYESNFFG
ncbi:EpsG family protein [Lederbergia citrea]|uniref:EpsG family protein n=1 Tax=Lederbergia citrea TaxID=2833581 RepID=A0A942UNL5_9BACI|nr:EpsG family protein [Lederbergia citrea]MBS4205816.1 EpsG family protein [Lederbergia citrea]MBS4224736.1 EpsG family protein [Lederbergia citrea]